MLRRLRSTSAVSMGGTFQVSSLNFKQMYTSHRKFQNGMLPLVHIFLIDKTRENCEAVLPLIIQLENRINSHFRPDVFLLDSKIAMMNALRALFPGSLIKGCYLHFTQCLWQKCLKIGLKAHNKDPDVESPNFYDSTIHSSKWNPFYY